MSAIKVSELNNYIKKYIAMDYLLSDISVVGEISNLKYHTNGNIYFSLIDEKAKVDCIYTNIEDEPVLSEGDKLEIKGAVSYYELSGRIAFIVRELKNIGEGDVYGNFLKIKDKLEKEGLFKAENKKKIRRFPKSIGIITSITGAALQDILKVIKRRNSTVNIYIYPVTVQGKDSVESLLRGVKVLDAYKLDTIIIGRGGGSYEDLASFNDEELARAIFNSTTPFISAVGHEIDFTICDFVSDVRASTPSVAAELVTDNLSDVFFAMESLVNRLGLLFERRLKDSKLALMGKASIINNASPINILKRRSNNLEILKARLNSIKLTQNMEYSKYRLKNSEYRLNSIIRNRISYEVNNLNLKKEELVRNLSEDFKLKIEKLSKLGLIVNRNICSEKVLREKLRLQRLDSALDLNKLKYNLREQRFSLNKYREHLKNYVKRDISSKKILLERINNKLYAYKGDKLKAVVLSDDGNEILSISDVKIDSIIKIDLVDGSLKAVVRGKENGFI